MSKLEDKSKQGFFRRIKQTLQYFDHYLTDLTGYLMDRKPIHNHKLTSRNNHLEHSVFY